MDKMDIATEVLVTLNRLIVWLLYCGFDPSGASLPKDLLICCRYARLAAVLVTCEVNC